MSKRSLFNLSNGLRRSNERISQRATVFHELVFSIDADTPERRAHMLTDASGGDSLFQQFLSRYPEPAALQVDPISVRDRLLG